MSLHLTVEEVRATFSPQARALLGVDAPQTPPKPVDAPSMPAMPVIMPQGVSGAPGGVCALVRRLLADASAVTSYDVTYELELTNGQSAVVCCLLDTTIVTLTVGARAQSRIYAPLSAPEIVSLFGKGAPHHA